MNAVGLIFTDGFDVDIDDMIERRTLASIPFGGRYRLIDFPLSNLTNAGVKNIGVITKKNYQSLMDHVRGGDEWDLNRRFTGLTILPPFSTAATSETESYENRLEGLVANISYLRYLHEKYVIITGCDYIWNEDIEAFYHAHVASGARLSVMYTKKDIEKTTKTESTYIRVGDGDKVTKQEISNIRPKGAYTSLNTYIMEREDLMDILFKAFRSGKKSFRREVIRPMIDKGEANGYEAKSPIIHIDEIPNYLKGSLSLLDKDVRNAFFSNDDRPILTRVMDSSPTKYGDNAKVSNSIIADGSVIEGEVRNCIIFRNVHIEEGAVVENSVIMTDTHISKGARINYAVLDKNVTIEDNRWLSGYITHPFYCKRNSII